jgi:hypothetical protein
MVLTGGVHLAARERERKRDTGSGSFLGWLGRLGPRIGPSGLASSSFLFFVLILFLFSVFLFFHNFCKDTSIQIKLLPEIFKRETQYSKSVIKQVFN